MCREQWRWLKETCVWGFKDELGVVMHKEQGKHDTIHSLDTLEMLAVRVFKGGFCLNQYKTLHSQRSICTRNPYASSI